MIIPGRTKIINDIITRAAHNPLQIDELLSVHKISNTTLKRIIEEANDIISPSKLTIKKEALYFTLAHQHSTDYCISKILKGSIEYNFLVEIFLEETHSIFSLSEEMYISESTIKRLVKDINSYSSFLNFKISKKPFKIVGDEQTIRHFYIILLKEMYGVEFTPFRKKDKEFIRNLYENYHQKLGLQFNIQDYLNFELFALVTLQRERNGHTLYNENDIIPSRYELFKSFFTNEKNEALSYDGVPFEKIFRFLLTDGFVTSLTHLDLNNHNQKKIDEFIDNFEYIFNYTYSSENKQNLKKHIHEIIYGYLSLPDIYQPNIPYYKNFFSYNDFFFTNFTDVFSKLFYQHFPQSNSNNLHMLFYKIMVETDNLFDFLLEQVTHTNILIYINFDSSFGTYLKNKLDFLLPGKKTFTLVTHTEDYLNNKKELNNYDLIVTNYFFPEEVSNENYFLISHYITENDLNGISDHCKNIIKKKLKLFEEEVNQRIKEKHP